METKLLSNSENDLNIAAEIIRSGGTVVFPTETVYGLGADALNPDAVKKIFTAKGRPADNPLIVHIYDVKQLNEIVSEVPESAKKLMNKFWPGPLTIILKKSNKIRNEVTAGLDTVGVRMPVQPEAKRLLELSGVPIAAPSANLSGKPSPTAFAHCVDDMNGRVDAIIDGGDCNVGIESTVIDLSGEPIIYRPGDVTAEQIEQILNCKVKTVSEVKENEKPKSPGLKYKHYSPKAEVIIVKGSVEEVVNCVNGQKDRCGILIFDEFSSELNKKISPNIEIISLGSMKSPKEAASSLFKALREMDNRGVKRVFAPEIPSTDKWSGVRNRLYRAAGNRIVDTKDYFKKSRINPNIKSEIKDIHNILFVCTGNTCRSPMAEGIFNSMAENENLNVRASSAGIYVLPCSKVSKNSVDALSVENIDISKHQPKQLDFQLISDADLVLTMSSSHKSAIINEFPDLKNKVYTIAEFVGEKSDISDPFGGDLNLYKSCMIDIKSLIEKLILRIKANE